MFHPHSYIVFALARQLQWKNEEPTPFMWIILTKSFLPIFAFTPENEEGAAQQTVSLCRASRLKFPESQRKYKRVSILHPLLHRPLKDGAEEGENYMWAVVLCLVERRSPQERKVE